MKVSFPTTSRYDRSDQIEQQQDFGNHEKQSVENSRCCPQKTFSTPILVNLISITG